MTAWLRARPSAAIRLWVGAILFGLAITALLVPTNLSGFPFVTRVAAVGVGGAIAGSGMVIWERRPGNAIGPLLVVAGGLWILGRLQGAEGVALGLAANLSNSVAQVLMLAILIAFPAGRIPSRVAWAIIVFGLVAVVGANLTLVLSSETRRTPGLEASNPLFVAMDPTLRAVLVGGFQLATIIGGLWGIAWLIARWVRASGPARRAFLPIFLAGVAIASIVLGCQLLINRGGWTDGELYAIITIQILSFALLPAAIAVRVLRERMARGSVADLVIELGDAPAPDQLRAALSSALGDPTLEIAQWSTAIRAYVDAEGVPVDLPAPDAARAVTLLERDGTPLAAIIHDPALLDDPGLVTSVGSAVRLAVENERLAAEVRSQLDEVRASRTRIVEAADAERRRVERNLHDGAQQRLVALSLALRRAQAQLPAGTAPEAASTLDDAAEQLKEALAELRTLARGIHPAILTEAGLGPALRALARDSPIPTTAEIDLPEGLTEAVSAAAYFVAAEAMANVAKYADARSIHVRAMADQDGLTIEIGDDGKGGADPALGSGIRGLADRVAAVGGRLEVDSPVGGGTRVVANVPLATTIRAGEP
jgi:signal transduction histidine kinase